MQKSVLIIEDEIDLREAMADTLRMQNYMVYTAENGEIGLKLALANHPDLIMLDLMMPVMNGHEFLKKLRVDTWGRKASVIVLSAMDDVVNVANAHQEGLTEYLIKSDASLQELTKKVKEVILFNT